MVDKFDLACIRTMFTGAAPVGASSVEEAVQRLPSKPSFRQGTQTSVKQYAFSSGSGSGIILCCTLIEYYAEA